MPRPSLGQRWSRRLIGALVSLAFLWLAGRGVSWQDAWGGLVGANWLLLGIAGASSLVIICIRVERWRYLFYPQHKHLHLTTLTGIYLVGQLINTVVPARIGELARAYLAGEREGVSKAQGLWTTVLEKVLDSVVLLLFLGALSALIALPPWLAQAGWLLGASVVVGALVGGAMLWYHTKVRRWVTDLQARFRWMASLRLHRIVDLISTSVSLMSRPEFVLGMAGRSLLAFGAAVAMQWLAARALGVALSWGASIMLLCVLQISAIVPLPTSPGRVGLFHFLTALTLSVFGIERGQALSYAVALHLLVYLPIVVGGPLSMWLLSVGWRDVTRAATMSSDDSKTPSG